MDTFRWISVVVSMILGLGVTRLLTSAVTVFRARRRARIDHLPLVWAAAIFAQQIVFWWSLEEVSNIVDRWSLAEFLLLVGLVLTLFLAAALVLPPSEMAEGESLRTFFEQDGNWAALALAAFNALAILANRVLWGDGAWSIAAGLNLALVATALAGMARARRVQVAAAALYLALVVCGAAVLAPTSY